MKLRIRGNSIRLRLLRREVEELARRGSYSEVTEFGGGSSLTYSIDSSSEAKAVSASFKNEIVSVVVPKEMASEWANTDTQVGINAESDGLKILIEKDFACPTRKDDPDNLDSFPNPEIVCT